MASTWILFFSYQDDARSSTHQNTKYVTLIVFPLQQWLQESASVLRYRYIVCPVLMHSLKERKLGPKAEEGTEGGRKGIMLSSII